MQRVYEDNAGAEEEAKLKQEEERRERHLAAEAKRLDALEKQKRETRARMIADTTSFLFDQMASKEEVVKRERAEDEAYAQTVIADTELELQKEQEKKELARARALIQQSSLNEQVKLVRERKAKEVGAGEMTSLEDGNTTLRIELPAVQDYDVRASARRRWGW